MTPFWTLRIGGRNNSRSLSFLLFFLKARSDIHNRLEDSGKACPWGMGFHMPGHMKNECLPFPTRPSADHALLSFPLTGDYNREKHCIRNCIAGPHKSNNQ